MCQFFGTHYLVHKTRAKHAYFGLWSYFLGELYNIAPYKNNRTVDIVPYKNNKTVDFYLVIYILINISILPARL